MATSKLELLISLFSHKTATKFQWLTRLFGGPVIQMDNQEYCATNSEVVNPRWRPQSQTGNSYNSACTQDSNEIPMANPCFRCPGIEQRFNEPEVENPVWWHLNRKYYISASRQDRKKIPMAYPCFQCLIKQRYWKCGATSRSGKCKTAADKPEILMSQDSNEISIATSYFPPGVLSLAHLPPFP